MRLETLLSKDIKKQNTTSYVQYPENKKKFCNIQTRTQQADITAQLMAMKNSTEMNEMMNEMHFIRGYKIF